MFGRRSRQQPVASGNGPYVTHDLELTGKCPSCGRSVCVQHKHTVLMGLTGTASAMAFCGGCGYDQVPVSDQF